MYRQNERRGNASASGVVERAWGREEACGRREGLCGTRYVSRRAGASVSACPCGRAVRRYAVQQAPCGRDRAVVGWGQTLGVWGVGARVGVRSDVLCANLCTRTHKLHVRGPRVRGSLAAKSRSVGELSGTRAEAPGRRVAVAPRAAGAPRASRRASATEFPSANAAACPSCQMRTVTHNNSWRSRQQALPQYGSSHARDR